MATVYSPWINETSGTAFATSSTTLDYGTGTSGAGGTASSSGTAFDLNSLLYEPATDENLYRLKTAANNYLDTGTGTSISNVQYDAETRGFGYYINNYSPQITSVSSYDLDTAYVSGVTWDQSSAKRRRIKNNLTIITKTRALPVEKIPENERVAQETLREMITELEFRKYLKYGFVLVPGEGGKTFQVFKNESHTKVWKNGKVIEEVCVRIKYSAKVPPTDNVIAFMSMIQASEDEFKKLGNVYKMAEAA